MPWIFGGPSDYNGTGVHFDSLVEARAYAVRMLEQRQDGHGRVNIYRKNDPNWIIVPKNAMLGYVSQADWDRNTFYWVDYETGSSQGIFKNGRLRRR